MASTITRFKSYKNLWAELNRLITQRKPKNEDELFEILKNGWQTIHVPLEYLHRLIESMPSRCKAVIKSKGMPTKY